MTPGSFGRRAGAAGGFNPEVSLILQGQYRRMQDVPERAISGYWPAGGHDHGGDERGFSVDSSELIVSANISPYFRGMLNVALKDGEAEVEEAWFQPLGLGQGFTLKGGRFLSGIGYLNEQHPHAWDFADAPLMSKALFGEHYGQDGLQLKWVAPTDLFMEFGAEIGRGQNFPGTDRNQNGVGATSLFAHVGGDVGRSHAWRAGLSWLATRAKDREAHFEDTDAAGPNEVEGLFTGRSRTWIADFVWKWAPEGNPGYRNLKLQAELFRRTEDGDLACASGVATSPCAGSPALGKLNARQALLGVFKMPVIYAVAAALIFKGFGWVLPTSLDRGVTLMGNAAVPTMLVMLGLQFHVVKWNGQYKALFLAAGLRLLAGPLIALSLAPIFSLQGFAFQAGVLQSAMPTAVLTTVLATEFDAEPSFVSFVVFISMVLSPLTVTPILYLLGA